MRTLAEQQRLQKIEEIDAKEQEMFKLLTALGMPIEEQLLTINNAFRSRLVPLFQQIISPHSS